MPRTVANNQPERQSQAADSARPFDCELIERHGTPLRRYLRVLGCALDRVEDVLQETLLIALRAELTVRSDAETRAFLRQTAKNVLRNHTRSERRRREVEIADEVWQAQCQADDGQGYLAALQECIAALPERQQQLVQGAYRDQLGRDQIAATLGMQPEGIKTALRRLRVALRECVERKRDRS